MAGCAVCGRTVHIITVPRQLDQACPRLDGLSAAAAAAVAHHHSSIVILARGQRLVPAFAPVSRDAPEQPAQRHSQEERGDRRNHGQGGRVG